MTHPVCRYCGSEFTPKRAGRPPEFCSASCRRLHDNAVKKARRSLEAAERELTKVRATRELSVSASTRDMFARSEATWVRYVTDSAADLESLLR